MARLGVLGVAILPTLITPKVANSIREAIIVRLLREKMTLEAEVALATGCPIL